ncbi:MAG TPA: lipopolysaccharide heptosyltransferase II [Ktedonobacteraceae bacterium]|nr:lipopolysaccharide heptosyltransferase II [Ktedonobacteraceae bacterium]
MTQIDSQALTAYGEDDGYPTRPTAKQRLRKSMVRASRSALGKAIYAAVSIWGAGRSLRRLGQPRPPLRPATFQPRRILVIRLDLIGDLVLSMVVVRVLKRTYPEAEIDLISVPASARVIEGDPDLTRLLGYDPNIWRRPKALLQRKNWRELKALLKTLHGREYDLAISVFGKWAGVLAALSGARRTLGFGRESFPGLMTDSVPGKHWTPGEQKHEVDYCLELAQAAGATIEATDRYPRLTIPAQVMDEVDQLLKDSGVPTDRPLIACHVSANNGQSKRWPVPYWAALLDRLIGAEKVSVVLTGAPNDLPLIEKITRRMHERPGNLAGKTSLTQLAALLKRADLLISGDSGPMHMASAVDTPLIAIHGPTNPAHSGPVSQKATILRSDIWCSPCYQAKETADCRFFTTQCMKDITPERVFSVAHEKLQEQGRI